MLKHVRDTSQTGKSNPYILITAMVNSHAHEKQITLKAVETEDVEVSPLVEDSEKKKEKQSTHK
jgi:hypothetical protein